VRKEPKADLSGRIKEVAGVLGISELLSRRPNELSGGQRQRVALARALAVQPKVLLLDEPFGALDAQVRKELRRWLRRLHEQLHVTTVFVTHDQEEALELADEVVVMNKARIEQKGDPQTVYDQPASPFVIEFLGNANRLAAGSGKLKATGDEILYVRPHDVDIQRGHSDGHALRARVLHVFSAGSYGRVSLVRLDTGESFEAEIARDRLHDLDLQQGEEISVVFRHVRLFPRGQLYAADVTGGDLSETKPGYAPAHGAGENI
jgi:sulfate transport system ATP-binding protein